VNSLRTHSLRFSGWQDLSSISRQRRIYTRTALFRGTSFCQTLLPSTCLSGVLPISLIEVCHDIDLLCIRCLEGKDTPCPAAQVAVIRFLACFLVSSSGALLRGSLITRPVRLGCILDDRLPWLAASLSLNWKVDYGAEYLFSEVASDCRSGFVRNAVLGRTW